MNGNSVSGQTNVTGVYGTLGVASSANTPPGLQTPTTWADNAGNLWLFGGQTFLPSEGGYLELNDLWKFNPYTAEWTWVSGSGSDNLVPGNYGQVGVASPSNAPGGRIGGSGWTDESGNLWLFGGRGYDEMGNLGILSDLWKFDPVLSEWTWEQGTKVVYTGTKNCLPGVFGTLGVTSATNYPGGRQYAGAWVDGAGAFWMFGGMGCDATGLGGVLNDLWTYSPTVGQWTWMGGSNAPSASGVYGTLGVASNASQPGSRYYFANWTDADGDFWLFGGSGSDSVGAPGLLNDLWRFNPSTRQWAWISGSDTIGDDNCSEAGMFCARSSVYGTLGEPAPGNVLGGRIGPIGAAVANGSFLLFGGFDAPDGTSTDFDDLWQFNPNTGEWTWIGGSDTIVCGAVLDSGDCFNGETGIYGTEGTPAATNHPGSRDDHVSWADKAGNFWIFGGEGFDSQGLAQELNDIWQYRLAPLVAPPTAPTVTVSSSANPVFTENPFTLTAHVTSTNELPNSPGGTVEFSENVPMTGLSMLLGSGTVDASGNATLSLASLPVGTYNIMAAYGGDANNLTGIGSITETVGDFSLVTNGPNTATISSGGTATFDMTLRPLGPISSFPAAIGLTASGGPAGAVYSFTPTSGASGSAALGVTLMVTIPAQAASAAAGIRWPSAPVIPIALAGLVLPFVRRPGGDKRSIRRKFLAVLLLLVGGPGAALGVGGCGNSFYTRIQAPGAPPPGGPGPQTYTVTLLGASGALNHSATVTLTVN